MNALDDIRRACERLRRYPESRWLQRPRPPLGARPLQGVVQGDGDRLESQVQQGIDLLMRADADVRGVHAFTPDVSVFALPDVLEALARSLAGFDETHPMLRTVALDARDW